MSASLQLVTGNATDVGRERSENQDYFGSWDDLPVGSLWVVCDGMGGAAGGRRASTLAVESISRWCQAADPGLDPTEVLAQAIGEANRAVFHESQSVAGLKGMGTTVVALLIRGEKAWIAHVGDSRVYLMRDGDLQQLTHDHTLVQNMVDGGQLEASAAHDHPNSHILTKSIGIAETVEVEVGTKAMELRVGDRLVLCSDGLTGMVEDPIIAEIATGMEPLSACRMLVKLANERGGLDNITLQVVEVAEGSASPAGDVAKHSARNRWQVIAAACVLALLAIAAWWGFSDGPAGPDGAAGDTPSVSEVPIDGSAAEPASDGAEPKSAAAE